MSLAQSVSCNGSDNVLMTDIQCCTAYKVATLLTNYYPFLIYAAVAYGHNTQGRQRTTNCSANLKGSRPL